ncbi:MAG: TolC family protein [Myxococcota bacterium]|jgi:outer membrane protein TolC|nr:TolC family protein [Myxococcota bacterium]
MFNDGQSARRRCLSFALGLCVLLPHFAVAQEAEEPRRLSLSDAISMGLTRSPQIEAAEFASQKAALVVDEASWAWTPKLELSSTWAPMPKVELDSTDEKAFEDLGEWGFFTKNSVELGLPVFTFFKLSTVEELAEIGLDVELLKEREARLKVSYDVARAFYGLQLANAGLVVSKEATGLLERISREYEKLWSQGDPSVKKTDRYRIEMAASSLTLLHNELEMGRQLAEQGLRLHLELEGEFELPKMRFRPDEAVLLSLDAVLELARSKRLDLQMLDKAVQASELNAKLESLKWWPDIVFGARLNQAYSNAVPEVPEETIYAYDPYNSFGFGVALTLQWKLDPVNRYFKVAEADTELLKLQQQQQLARSAAALEVEKLYLESLNAQQQVDLVQSSRRSAKRFMTQELVDYEVGGGKVDDVISGVRGYIEQRSLYLQSLYDFRLSLVRLQLATGAESVSELLASGRIEDYFESEESEEADE